MVFLSPAEAFSDVRVKDILFEGNESFSAGHLKRKMRMKEASLFHLRRSSRVDEVMLQQDIGFIEADYHKNGFLECTVTETVMVNGNDMATILIRVDEGPRTTISRVNIRGLESLVVPELIGQLEKSFDMVAGAPLDLSQFSTAEHFIKNRLADRGHPFATVNRGVTRQGTEAEVIFQVTEGPEVHIRDISYRGNRQSQKFIIRRELLFRKGDRFNRSKILESQQRIYTSGLYTYVNIEPVIIDGDSSTVDMLVTVAERKKRWTGIRGGVGQQEELDMTFDGAGEWGHRNLYGTGRRFSLEAGASVNVRTQSLLSNEYSYKYTEPWVLNTRTPLTVDLYFRRFKWELYDLQEVGVDLRVRHEFPQKLVAWVTFVYKRADVFNVPPELKSAILGQAGVDIVRKMTFGAERDIRDHPLYPSRGIYSQVYSEYTGGILGGNKDFYKLVASWSGYQKWLPETVAAGRIKWGMAKEFGQSKYVPIYDRFFAGGANTLRGYVERHLGPLENGKPIGGTLLFLSNVELRRQLFWRFGISLFLDSGYLWENIVDFHWSDVRFSTGAGLQFFTPVGPLRLEYGHKLRKEEGLKRGAFHISLLYAF
jgi:outer membrane protein insertion porin family